MEKTPKVQGGDIVAIATMWGAGVMFALFMCIQLLSSISDTGVKYWYDQDNIGQYVTLIGDSITVMSKKEIEAELPGVDIDAANGISFADYRKCCGESGVARIKKKIPREVIVFLLGTNDKQVDTSDIDQLRSFIGKRRKIILMTSYRGDTNEQESTKRNAKIYQALYNRNNILVLDWYIANFADPDTLLLADHIHPNKEGRKHLAKMIKQLVYEALELN